ncbi:MAG: tRNA epoxyqueuosine(34) reductase QueG [Ignavibacteriales bacterium]|nr:tRNA epoxyqueuosine(34) reductase QueG [Ignavibacteriales bacterium]
MMTLSEKIAAKAIELGFAKVGFAHATAHPEEAERLKRWLVRGYHGSMRWMDRNRDKRADVSIVLPGVKSVISLADNYFSGGHHSNGPAMGKISRYAWGNDYHRHLLERIEMLAACIKEMAPDSESRSYVDTGPLMEKMWAEKSGIGWRGKHSNVITREFGSWVFLGEILTTLELEYNDHAEDLCGTCIACIEACPTGAIAEPYVVDSNKCIAYLTIEHRGSFDGTIASPVDGWLFGCDVCQEVCPWNRFEKETDHPEYQPRAGNAEIPLQDAVNMTQEEFNQRFSGSPVERTKRDGLARNASALLRH